MVLSNATELLDLLVVVLVFWNVWEACGHWKSCAGTCAEASREVWWWRRVAFFEAALDIVVACGC